MCCTNQMYRTTQQNVKVQIISEIQKHSEDFITWLRKKYLCIFDCSMDMKHITFIYPYNLHLYSNIQIQKRASEI